MALSAIACWLPVDKSVAARLMHVLSLGHTVDPPAACRAFRGRDPKVEALMRKRGFSST